MKLAVDERGHIQLPGGRTTSPLERRMCYVGNSVNFIGFDALVLPDNRVALHSMLSLESEDVLEDFLYEVVKNSRALEVFDSMVTDAAEYLFERGYALDANDSPQLFLNRLAQELGVGLH